MSDPTATLWVVPKSLTWLTTITGVTTADVITVNTVDFTAGASTSGATFLFNATQTKTTPGLATVINSSGSLSGVTAYATGPFSLDMAAVANNDTLAINGNTLTAKTSGASGASQFNLGSDHGASELAALINASALSGITGTIRASASSTTVTITGNVTKFVASTASHGVLTAADAVLTLTGYVDSYSFTIASGDATMTPQILQGSVSAVVCTVTGGSYSDMLTESTIITNPSGEGSSAVPFWSGSNPFENGPLLVPSSTAKTFTQYLVGFNYNLGGETYDFDVSMSLSFQSAITVTSSTVPIGLVVPDLSST